ncbi:MAG: hypothetical protein ACOVQG_02885 [Crocinitomicaceae bacterium]
MRKIKLLLFLFSCFTYSHAQKLRSVVNGYGHMNYNLLSDLNSSNDPTKSYFELGEHDLFVNSYFNNRISFLGEFVVRYTKGTPTNFSASIERARLKLDYYKNHSILLGKIHTPVNYWNDVYHHGRVFFPTIDRPISFSHIVPLHNLGVQFQGQNLGKWNFGYDIAIGNGISSTDAFDENLTPATTIAFHIKPIDNLRIGASYFYDFVSDASVKGIHTGHTTAPGHFHGTMYKGALNYHLASTSIAYFGDRHEFLNEFAFNPTQTDSLGVASNFSNFTYYGYRIKEKHVPFIVVDLLKIAENDLYTYHYDLMKFCLGYRYEFNELINVKAQVGYASNMFRSSHSDIKNVEFKVQFAYGF